MKRFVNIYVPVTTCNLKCEYCYITQSGLWKNKVPEFKYSSTTIQQALSKERLGGICHINICGGGETLIPKQIDILIIDPHAKILEQVKPILKDKYDIDLEVKVLDDYYIFNKALNSGEVDANYFQHRPFFNEDVDKNNYDIVEAGAIHIEPFGFYSKTIKSKDDIKDGAEVIISNSVADHGRILAILADAGLITIKDGVKVLNATVKDIATNPKN